MEKVKKLKTQLDYPVQRRQESCMAVQPQAGIAMPQGNSKPAK